MRWFQRARQPHTPASGSTLPVALDELAAAKRDHLLRLDDEALAINVVLGNGKTGTTAIATSLRRAGLSPVLHIHNLGARATARQEAQFRLLTPAVYPRHIWDAQWLAAHLPSHERPWKIVTSVRDPIAVQVSRWFQASARFGGLEGDVTVSRVVEGLSTEWERMHTDWFDFQFKQILGIDVYEHSFEPTRGYAVIETERADVLLLRQESFDKAPVALSAFFAVPVAHFRPENVGLEKGYAPLYREVLECVRPPLDHVERVYSSRMARHFYSSEELAGFRRHWTRPAG